MTRENGPQYQRAVGNSSLLIHKVERVQMRGHEPGTRAYNRLTSTHHKHLNRGGLIDERTSNRVDCILGERIHFRTERFP